MGRYADGVYVQVWPSGLRRLTAVLRVVIGASAHPLAFPPTRKQETDSRTPTVLYKNTL